MSATLLHNGTVLSGIAVMEKCSVLVEDGHVVDVFNEKRFGQKRFDSGTTILDVDGAYLAPGFIDTHIHGFAGWGTEDASAESFMEMSKALAAHGVTSFCPTLYPAEVPQLLSAIRAGVGAMGQESGAAIMGMHLEGPFISPGRLGAQRADAVRSVDMDLMEELWQASSGHLVNMTVAPELKGMRELALYCGQKGIVLQAGHTNATYENMVEGMQAGILHSTHLFNAMSEMHHRNPNAVGAILIHPEISCEIIADGHHVHPDLIRLLVRDKPLDKIVLVTDALKPTEQASGPMTANGEEVYLKDGCFHRSIDDVIAGSSLTMARGLKNLISYGVPVPDAVRIASSNPARVMRFQRKGMLLPGFDADIVVFDRDVNILLSMVGGIIRKKSL